MITIRHYRTNDIILEIANLRWADLRWANLRGADLRGANLRWANLRWADLRGANLREADLRGADLRWADLRGADLRWADLREADLRGADLLLLQAGSYTAIINSETTSIGRETHKSTDWLTWTPEDVTHMADDAEEWWTSYGEIVKSAIRKLQEDFPREGVGG